ncbi:MAG TPA: NfeD family protein [Spirochaetes bacterium]|nr:NfeD family protein [Spirochaetota bacterium]
MNLSPLVWLAVGIVIMAMEILLPGFVIFWFGLGGLLTALGVYIGLLKSAEAQWFFFFVSSLALLGLWFGVLKKKLAAGKTADSRDPTLLDLKGVCTRAVRPGMPGEVELFDNFHGIKTWQAESTDDIPEGEEIRVVEARGIKLVVAKLS